MVHLLAFFCLCCIHLTRQKICSAPGDLPPPKMLLNSSSRDKGGTVLLKCIIPLSHPFTRVILCKNGIEMSSQQQKDSKFGYDFYYNISTSSAVQLSCMYQYKYDNNQVKNSHLSKTKYLSVPGPQNITSSFDHQSTSFPLAVGAGITIAFIFILAAVYYMLEKRVKWRATREHGMPTSDTEAENQSRDPSVDPLDEDNSMRFYSEVSPVEFNGTYCQVQETQAMIFPVYSSVTVKKKQEAHHTVEFHEVQEAKEMIHPDYSYVNIK
ncbi:uncharacterized protein LOC134406265 [Elgaria multicarinata webbii]|uniref:uncharacterized protein LOC134406265 n=1 Tax=Elgaria multicarinata webbii TaxID=159646 RepID=UPI002FCD36D1